MSLQLFLSAVSDEFRQAREQLRRDLTSRDVVVHEQQDFRARGHCTLELLDDYIGRCDAVIHLVGDKTGDTPGPTEIAALLQRYPDLLTRFPPIGTGANLSYTQWEAWLALYHGCRLYIARGEAMADHGPQAGHLANLQAARRFPACSFTSPDSLAKHALLWLLDIVGVPLRRQPRNLPYGSLGPLFKGRDDIVATLRQALARPDRKAAAVVGKALHGLGGVGKTRLAVEFALSQADEYAALLFVPADSAAKLDAGLAALTAAPILDLPEKDASEDAVKIQAVRRWLDSHMGWLLILDNIDDDTAAAAAETLLAPLCGGHVLITGRLANFSPGIETFELDVLSIADAADYLLASTKRRERAAGDAAQARDLAETLGGLALALAQAGAYINQQRIGFARYLRLWRDQRNKVLTWFDQRLVSYNHDVGLATTWATSVEKLTPAGRRLLDLGAFFDPAAIPKSLLDVPLPSIEGAADVGDAAPNPGFDGTAALADLFAYSLASPAEISNGNSTSPGFTVHRLVQDFTRDTMPAERRDAVLRQALAWVDAAFVGHPNDVRNWPLLDPLAPHALAVARHGDAAKIAAPTAYSFGELALLFKAKARYRDAEPLFRRALAIDEASLGPDHPTVAIRLNNFAEWLRETNRLAEAEPLYRRALAIDEASLGPDHPTVAIRLNNLAVLLRDTNRRAEAEPLYRRALAIDEASYGPDHPTVATRLNNLALLLHDTNRLTEAEPLYRRALDIDEASYGPDHPNVASSLNNLAILLRVTNRLAEAEPLYRRALAIDEASYGPDHPNVARDLNNLATLLYDTNRLSEAEPMFCRALAIDEASYGPDHPTVARDLNNLAELLRTTNRLAEAEPLYRRALVISEASLGPDHPNVAIGLNNLATLLHDTNRLTEAEPLLRRALAIFEASYGPDHPHTQTVRANIQALPKPA